MAAYIKLSERRTIFILVDLSLLFVSVLFGLKVWAYRGGLDFRLPFMMAQAHWFIILPGLWLLVNIATNAYRLKIFTQIRKSFHALLISFMIIFFIYSLIYFFSLPNSLPRGIVLSHGAVSLLLMSFWRGVYPALTLRPSFKRRTLIVGAGKTGQLIGEMIQDHLDLHYDIVGFIDDAPEKTGQEVGLRPEGVRKIRVLGTSRDLVSMVLEHNVSQIVLAIKSGIKDETFQALLASQEQGITITLMPVLFEQMTGRVPIEHIGANWYFALPLNNLESEGVYPILKRLLDLLVAFVGGILFLIGFPLIYLAIRADSRGPVFYSQTRVGKGGRPFRTWKLRTMVIDAERPGEAVWAKAVDPRITRVGKWLRRTRVDEFPQFLNILKGEMSAVGPRPERPEFVSDLEKTIPYYRLRHAVKPGMAGWAMIHQDYAGTVEDVLIRLQYDLYYVKYQSIGLDLFILIQTFGKLLKLKGR